jgi:hypothetical protein
MKNKSLRKYKKNTKNKINKNDYRSTKKRRLNQKRGGADEEECSICYDPINEDNKVTTPCKHNFHKECLIQTCKVMYWRTNNICRCPLCREDIDISTNNLLPIGEKFDPKHLTVNTFPLYINYMLSILPEENPDDTLEKLLLSFTNKRDLPLEVHDPITNHDNENLIPNIMQFKKMHVANRLSDRKPLFIYYFTGFIKKVPGLKLFRRNKKYYAFLIDESGITYELEEIG